MQVELYDTTLRDGTQREGISLSVEDKLKIARKLDELGVHYIEGGWPGSNPKDAEFFVRARGLKLAQRPPRRLRHHPPRRRARPRPTPTCAPWSTPARRSSPSSARPPSMQVPRGAGDDARGEPGHDRATPSAT